MMSKQKQSENDEVVVNVDADAQDEHDELASEVREMKEVTKMVDKIDESDDETVAQNVEAVLMTVEKPITVGKIAETLGFDTTKSVTAAIKRLNAFYKEHDRSFGIEQVAGGYQIFTLAKFRGVLGSLHRTRVESKLSPAAMETLAVIAYRQPVLRADIEAVRGVACGEMIRSLMDKHLVKIVGRAEEIGRPMLYGTTRRFLEVFGLSNLKDLPKVEELIKP